MSYFSMNEVSVGTEVKIKNSDLKGRVVEVFHFPTTFKVEYSDGRFDSVRTHAVEFIDE